MEKMKAKSKYGLSFQNLLSQTGIELWIPKRFLTLSRCQPLIKSYLELAKRIDRKEGKEGIESVIQETKSLKEQIENFFKTDAYMSQAIHENAQIPYADWDENYGGS